MDPENEIRRPKRKPSSNKTRSKKSVPSVKTIERVTEARPEAGNSNPVPPASQAGSDRSEETCATAASAKRMDEDDHVATFQRAADLLLDSLSLQTGGVVFMDTSTSHKIVCVLLCPSLFHLDLKMRCHVYKYQKFGVNLEVRRCLDFQLADKYIATAQY